MNALLEITDLTVGYETAGQRVVLVDSVSLRLDEGEVLCLVGESGSGKSVTMLAVLGLLSDVAEQKPLLWIIDDAQWLDEASSQTLAFVARRLGAESVAMVVGIRDGARKDDFVGLDDLWTERPEVVEGMEKIYQRWVRDFDIDGFRIDTVKHVNTEFWTQWATALDEYAARRGRDDFFMFGEVYSADPAITAPYVTEGRLDATLDFPFQDAARTFASQGGSADKLAKVKIPTEVMDKVPVRMAEAQKFIPIAIDGERKILSIVAAEPQNTSLMDEIALVTGMDEVYAFIGLRSAIEAAIRKHYYGDPTAFASFDPAGNPGGGRSDVAAMTAAYESRNGSGSGKFGLSHASAR